MTYIKLRGKDVPLLYTTYEMKVIQEEIAPISKAIDMVCGRNPDDKTDTTKYGSADHLDAVAKLIRIMGNAGLEENGEEPELTDKKVLRALKPSELASVINECMNEMNIGMHSEIPEEKEKGPVDVTLEELNKKKEMES